MVASYHLKLNLSREIEFLIAEAKYGKKDFRIIDCEGNSLLFHKNILQNVSNNFDYLNKFLSDCDNDYDQMRLRSLDYNGLQTLYSLIYSGPVGMDEKQACEIVNQLTILQLPITTEVNFDKFLSYNSNGTRIDEVCQGDDQNRNIQLPTATSNYPLSRSLIIPSKKTDIFHSRQSKEFNVDKVHQTSHEVHWVNVNQFDEDIVQRGGQYHERSISDKLTSCNVKRAQIQSKPTGKQDMASLHQMTVTSMTSASMKSSDGLNRELKKLTDESRVDDEKEKFLADFGLFYSPRPITRSLVKMIGGNPDNFPRAASLSSPSTRQSASVAILPSTKTSTTSITRTVSKLPSDNDRRRDPREKCNQKKQQQVAASTNNSSSVTIANNNANKQTRLSNTASYGPKSDSSTNNNGQRKRGRKQNASNFYNGNTRVNKENDLKSDSEKEPSDDEDTFGKKRSSTRTSQAYDSSEDGHISEGNTSDSSELDPIDTYDEDESDESGKSDSDLSNDSLDSRSRESPHKSRKGKQVNHFQALKRFKSKSNKLRYIERKISAMKQVIRAVIAALPDKQNFLRYHGFECFICGDVIARKKWKSHILVKHYHQRFYCSKCGLSFKDVSKRNIHLDDCQGL